MHGRCIPVIVTQSHAYHWLISPIATIRWPITALSTGIPHSMKRPLENRVWYWYAGQSSTGGAVGTYSEPTKSGACAGRRHLTDLGDHVQQQWACHVANRSARPSHELLRMPRTGSIYSKCDRQLAR